MAFFLLFLKGDADTGAAGATVGADGAEAAVNVAVAAGMNDVCDAERRAREVRLLRPCTAPPPEARSSNNFTLETSTGCFAPVLFH